MSIIKLLALGGRDQECIRIVAEGQAVGEAIGVLTALFRRGLRPEDPQP